MIAIKQTPALKHCAQRGYLSQDKRVPQRTIGSRVPRVRGQAANSSNSRAK
jgi:hypothetical protein